MLQFQCSSIKGYLINRGNDFIDIVNIGFEDNIYGGGIYIDSIMFGLAYGAKDSSGVGLRFGHLGMYQSNDSESNNFLKAGSENGPCRDSRYGTFGQLQFLFFATSNYHEPRSIIMVRNYRKNIAFMNVLLYGASKRDSSKGLLLCYRGKKYHTIIRDSYVVLPMEVSFGLYYGIRLGFNPHELLDFIVGIFGFDLLDDDTTTVYVELPVPM
ncbi:MAG TPA: hypothetical protein PK079_05690 [Leptospiraceae bacterium]|nr:hypothetical protein [Leptospiraceae bacterium]HMX31458.1 hypothetical protein [Leptospiraceae bacterium]HMY33568.1 hypothetical protein [Leptospiraceae bacterium]HMZ62567.1 hypothetical protein [Leptospiraceae bacterium]HNA09252.1 hypothetical protein [Leptospiraceae bacterium]